MRNLSILAFASFLVLWGIHSYLKDSLVKNNSISEHKKRRNVEIQNKEEPFLTSKEISDLEKIGSVINKENVVLESEKKNEIKVAKNEFDFIQNLKERQNLLEQSYMDRSSSIKDIVHLQYQIRNMKLKLNQEAQNTEKWNPKFVYYLMIQEDYTYSEINNIRSMNENGFNIDEMDYINEQIKDKPFLSRIKSFKKEGEMGRRKASFSRSPKDKDDFITSSELAESTEDKLIEMNYNQEDKGEMTYVNN